MVVCSVFGCKSRTDKRQYPGTPGRSFFQFPAAKGLRKAWLAKLNRQNFKLSKYSKVCDKHFAPECFTINPIVLESIGWDKMYRRIKDDAIPTLLLRGEHAPPEPSKRSSRYQRKQVLSEINKLIQAEANQNAARNPGMVNEIKVQSRTVDYAMDFELGFEMDFEKKSEEMVVDSSSTCSYNTDDQPVAIKLEVYDDDEEIGNNDEVAAEADVVTQIKAEVKDEPTEDEIIIEECSEERPVPGCETCGKTFPSLSHLEINLRIHCFECSSVCPENRRLRVVTVNISRDASNGDVVYNLTGI